MYPELVRIGDFPVNTYGVLLAIAFLAALLIAARLAARDGLPRERIYDLGLWMLVAALIGSKVLLLFTEPSYRGDLTQLFTFNFLRSGGVFYGGFIGAVIVGYLLIRRYGLPWWQTADAFAPGIALGQAIGRQGCFAAGCCWGKPTTLPWGVMFSERGHQVTGVPIDVHLHPTQLYESFASLAIFFFLIWLHRRKTFSGQVILLYAALYAITRFVVEFYRDNFRGDMFGISTLTGLSTSQLIAASIGLISLVLFFLRWQRSRSAAATASSVRPGGLPGLIK